MTEREAHDEILRICRSGRRKDGKAQNGIWCMRDHNGKCKIIDNARWDGAAVAEGRTWLEVLEKMP